MDTLHALRLTFFDAHMIFVDLNNAFLHVPEIDERSSREREKRLDKLARFLSDIDEESDVYLLALPKGVNDATENI